MSQPYVGEIRMFGGNFAPAGWMFCNGQLVPISDYETLFNLIGTTYGGDGQSTFALPNLQSRLPLHQGNGFTLAETGGVEQVTLTVNQIPSHNHPLVATSTAATATAAAGDVLAQTSQFDVYLQNTSSLGAMAPATIGNSGGSQPHDNMQPYLCVSFIISLFGIFPSQT